MFPLEYHLLETFVVDSVGKFLGIDPTNATKKILGFVLHSVLMWHGNQGGNYRAKCHDQNVH
jgi:hypothetical protein